MATDNIKIQGYLRPELSYKLEQFKKDKGLKSDSQALNKILEEYFTVSKKSSYSSNRFDEIIKLIDDRLEARINPVQRELDYLTMKVEKIISELRSEAPIKVDIISESKSEALIDLSEAPKIILTEPIVEKKEITSESKSEALTTNEIAEKLRKSRQWIEKYRLTPKFAELGYSARKVENRWLYFKLPN